MFKQPDLYFIMATIGVSMVAIFVCVDGCVFSAAEKYCRLKGTD